MFESAELGHEVSKSKYEREVPALREALLEAQYEVLDRRSSATLILIGGVDGAGKGETVNVLNEWLDPRHVHTHALGVPTEDERARPAHWRFWRSLPPRGKVGIYFGSWYTQPIVQRVFRQTSEAELDQAVERIVELERMLADERVTLVKIWFHLSKAQQKKRLEALSRDKKTRWRVTEKDWEHFALYDRFRKISERVLRHTSSGHAPWHVVEGLDARYRSLTAGGLVLSAMRAQIERDTAAANAKKAAAAKVEAAKPETAKVEPSSTAAKGRKGKGAPHEPGLLPETTNLFKALDLKSRVDKDDYEKRLEELQGRLNLLTRHKKFPKIGVVGVFEGVDAAGKGGAIRRVTQSLDARVYRIHPIAAPTEEERVQPYLWRFWRHVPQHGSIAIFDRSWYGRVLVERVERFCRDEDWQRAFGEINAFEESLVEHGLVVVKIWMHVDPAEQLKRFEERQATGFKRFKITEEDWRNREKWPAYEVAACQMFDRTSTEIAPWKIVAANDKRGARLTVLETLCDRIAAALDRA
ncbi:MAG: polyphosphate:AMP phosphotransferase [Sandaracinaceae bacterium]|nr:polyphosphate:AMP phosphotransferase [Sandaracinaceae bacterium]